jgi:hypothetical protein
MVTLLAMVTVFRVDGAMVRLLVTGPKGRGFKPGPGDGFPMATESSEHLLSYGK